MKISKRSNVEPFRVMEIMNDANAREMNGQHIIHMEVGQPGTPASQNARNMVKEHLQEPLGYSLALGREDLRKAISDKYRKEIGREISYERIILTTGSSAGFQLAFTALFDVGDRVGIAEPGYPSYRNILKALSLDPIGIETQISQGFQPVASDISSKNLDGILVASPANPTGTVLSKLELSELIHKSQSENVTFISDEIYHGLTYGSRATSALEITDDVIVINSFSKYYSMTGWRLGWMVVPENLVKVFEPLAQNMFICPPHISQIAALGALNSDEECERNLEVYQKNRAHILATLPDIGIEKFSSPDGGFYVYCDTRHLAADSTELVQRWLDVGVAATPGWDFDPKRGGDYVRLSYARSHEDIVEGMKRLKNWVKSQ